MEEPWEREKKKKVRKEGVPLPIVKDHFTLFCVDVALCFAAHSILLTFPGVPADLHTHPHRQ